MRRAIFENIENATNNSAWCTERAKSLNIYGRNMQRKMPNNGVRTGLVGLLGVYMQMCLSMQTEMCLHTSADTILWLPGRGGHNSCGAPAVTKAAGLCDMYITQIEISAQQDCGWRCECVQPDDGNNRKGISIKREHVWGSFLWFLCGRSRLLKRAVVNQCQMTHRQLEMAIKDQRQ